MKTTQLAISSALATIASTAVATADFTISAPGMTPIAVSQLNYQSPFIKIKNTKGENFKHYKITGYSYRFESGRYYTIADDAPWYVPNTGKLAIATAMQGHNGSYYVYQPYEGSLTAQSNFRAQSPSGSWSNGWIFDDLAKTFDHKDDIRQGTVTFNPPLIFDNSSIEFEFSYITNMKGGNNWIKLEGEASDNDVVTSSEINRPPTGTLTINKTMVRQGDAPPISWDIKLPVITVADVVTINDKEGTVVPKEDLIMKVYMIGTGVTAGTTQVRTENYLSINNSWTHIFSGRGDDVKPADLLYSTTVKKGEIIKFKARYNDPERGYEGSWKTSSDKEIIMLTDGDEPPSNPISSGDNAQTAEEYLSDITTNGKIDIGDLDFIYCAELTHTYGSTSTGYDLQDSIILIRFEQKN